MEPIIPQDEELTDLLIETLGEATMPSPLGLNDMLYTDEAAKILVHNHMDRIEQYIAGRKPLPAFESAGPRRKIFFDPQKITCGIVTCGGLCPGLNDVIRTIVLTLQWQYGVKRVVGFRYGYSGLSATPPMEPIELDPAIADEIHHRGGTILGTSRGASGYAEMVDTLERLGVSILFTIGGDGTLTGAHGIAEEIAKRKLSISVVGIPKTIDNDINCSEMSFGFVTAVEEAQRAIFSAHEEAKSAYNGMGLVKLMGRDSGFIAAHASLSNSDVNFCLIPEVSFTLHGEDGLLERLRRRLERKRHAVIVVAEGVGQDSIVDSQTVETDASGNICYKDIGLFLEQAILDYFKHNDLNVTLKYIDPSYMIRSCPANATDSAFCLLLGRNAVHAAMAGKTDMFVGYWNQLFTHVPLSMAMAKRKRINPRGMIWQTIRSITD